MSFMGHGADTPEDAPRGHQLCFFARWHAMTNTRRSLALSLMVALYVSSTDSVTLCNDHRCRLCPQLWGTSDPYATFSLGDSFGRSSVVDRNCDPEWNETFYLFVKCVIATRPSPPPVFVNRGRGGTV